MERRAEVLRTIEVADGEKLKPGTVIGEDVLAGWREQNLHSMVKDGRLRLISESSGDAVELAAQNAAQADRIRELEALLSQPDQEPADIGELIEKLKLTEKQCQDYEATLKEHDLMFDETKHMVKLGQPVKTRGGKFRRKTRS